MPETAQGSQPVVQPPPRPSPPQEKSGFNLNSKVYLAIIVGIIMISGLLTFLYLHKKKFASPSNLNQTQQPKSTKTINVKPAGTSVNSGGGGSKQASTEAASPTIEKIIKAKVTDISASTLAVEADNQQAFKIPLDKIFRTKREQLQIGQSITLFITQDRQNNILSAEVNIR